VGTKRGECLMITNDEYIRYGGMSCPRCKSKQIIDLTSVSTDRWFGHTGGCSQELQCKDCKLEWEDLYIRSGYHIIETSS